MLLTISADATNQKNIPTLLEEMGYSIPCNCHGAHHCNGMHYPFDCSLIPKSPITIDWEPLPHSDCKSAKENLSCEMEQGTGDTILIDIGTTTIAFVLLSRKEKILHQRTTIENPQRRFGMDVIARILSACEGQGEQIKTVLIHAIKTTVTKLCATNKQHVDSITACYIGGNTTMIHLLMGFDCTPLSHSPFTPRQTSPEPFFFQQCNVYIAPWFSAFVGGDVYAGMFACQMWQTKQTCLLLDLGTNGEIVLSHHGIQYVTSTAAGPAFEAGNLSCGCASIPGAISKVTLRRLRPQLETINNKLPIGLCGSGAISLCAELLRKKYVTKDGILTNLFPSDGYLLGMTTGGSKLTFTADDFRNVQLAVAAIAAGIDTLLNKANVSPQEVAHIYLGGGFGFHISKEDCQTLGIFSNLNYDCLHPVGNSCLQGLFRFATEHKVFPKPESVMTVNLAEQTYFQKQFVKHMTFPNSD